jgi:hypothetical protein
MRSGMELLRRSMGKSFRSISESKRGGFTTVQNPEFFEYYSCLPLFYVSNLQERSLLMSHSD